VVVSYLAFCVWGDPNAHLSERDEREDKVSGHVHFLKSVSQPWCGKCCGIVLDESKGFCENFTVVYSKG
jgi:hypothetical protein